MKSTVELRRAVAEFLYGDSRTGSPTWPTDVQTWIDSEDSSTIEQLGLQRCSLVSPMVLAELLVLHRNESQRAERDALWAYLAPLIPVEQRAGALAAIEREQHREPSTPGAAESVWCYARHRDDECWRGKDLNREQAIQRGRETFPGESFWIASATKPSASAYVTMDAEWLTERMAECAQEEHGDFEDWPPTPTREAEDDLESKLAAWADRYCSPTFVIVDGTPEQILPGESS